MTRKFIYFSAMVGLILQMQSSAAACAGDEHWPFHQPQDSSLWERALGPQEKDASFIINDIPIDYRARIYWLYPFTVKQHETITFDFDTNGNIYVVWQSKVASR